MISLRQVVENTFVSADLSNGIRHELWNPAYDAEPSIFPFITSGKQSLRSVLEHWDTWPGASDFTELAAYPDDKVTFYSNNLQGVSQAEDFWIFSQRERKMTAWNINIDLDTNSNVTPSYIQLSAQQLDPQYDHFGGCSTAPVNGTNQHLVIDAVEGKVPNVFAFFTFNPHLGNGGTWEYLGTHPIGDQQGTGSKSDTPWVSFWPNKQLFISSRFNGNLAFIYQHTISVIGGTVSVPSITELVAFEFYTNAGTQRTYNRVQSAVISSNQRLYLTSDEKIDKGGGLYGIDLVSGRSIFKIPIDGKGGDVALWTPELEGLTIWDINPYNPPNTGGQVHMTVLNAEVPEPDKTSIKHWEVSSAAKSHL